LLKFTCAATAAAWEMVAGSQNGHVLTLPLERFEPTACTKGLPRMEKFSEECWNSGLKVLPVHNPCDLESTKNFMEKIDRIL
jgi:hypothetical protein